MNRRPLCQAALLTALGIALQGRSVWLLPAAALMATAAVLAEFKCSLAKKKAEAVSKRPKLPVLSLLLIPFWLYMGMQRMEHAQSITIPADNGSTAAVSGVIYDRQDKEDKVVLYLKNVIFLDHLNNQERSKVSHQIQDDYCGTCIAYYKGEQDCAIGNTIRLRGTISYFEEGKNPGQFDARSYYQGQGIDFSVLQTEIIGNDGKEDWLKSRLYTIRDTVHKKLDDLAGEEASILQAMLLGEKSQMDSEIKELYQKSGISHVLVISGLHFSMLGMCLYKVLRRLGCSFRAAGCISTAVLFLYGVMTGFGISAVRAFIMFGISIGAAVLGKGYDLPSALGASVLYLLYQNPFRLFQTGFLLSVGAILGIILVLPVLDAAFLPASEEEKEQPAHQEKAEASGTDNPWRAAAYAAQKGLQSIYTLAGEGIRSGLAIQIATFPILLNSFYEFSPYSILLNCVVIPMLSIVIDCAVLAVLLSFILPSIAGLVILPSIWGLKCYEFLCRLAGRLPCSTVTSGKPEFWEIILYYLLAVLLGGMVYVLRRKRKEGAGNMLRFRLYPLAAGGFFAAAVYYLLVWQDRSGLMVSMLDVGQGQSVYIRSGGIDILYDGGSSDVSKVGQYRIAPFLKASGVDRLELVIVSHMDADHYNGVKELLERELIGIDVLLLPELEHPDESYQKLAALAGQKGTSVQTVCLDDCFWAEEAVFRVLHPSLGYRAADKNDSSIVMEMEYGGLRMLFTGDVEKGGEASMLKAGVLADVDILQTAHHGSDSSSTMEFLEAVRPEVALISCGQDNRYGHPSPETLERLETLGCCWYSTMEEGCITFEADGISDSRLESLSWNKQ